jgi:hypothetical protein
MIQFVCVREGGRAREGRSREARSKIGSYRSLTADKIMIHPGSVMFRADPTYIVAGEIVRTSKMYAMSVSPLSREVLERIRPGLFAETERDGEQKPPRLPKLKEARDFTNNIKISGEVFDIVNIKGKKTVLLPWEKLKNIGEDTAETFYKELKGRIIVNNQYSLLAGEKLELILSLAPKLDVENAFSRNWPRKRNFNSEKDLASLLNHLDSLAMPVIWKKGKKDLGILGLYTDGGGNYWFRPSRGFYRSLNESLSSLETLIDELGEEVDIEQKHIVNQCYRRLSDCLG